MSTSTSSVASLNRHWVQSPHKYLSLRSNGPADAAVCVLQAAMIARVLTAMQPLCSQPARAACLDQSLEHGPAAVAPSQLLATLRAHAGGLASSAQVALSTFAPQTSNVWHVPLAGACAGVQACTLTSSLCTSLQSAEHWQAVQGFHSA